MSQARVQRVAAEIDPQLQPLDFNALFLIPERVLRRILAGNDEDATPPEDGQAPGPRAEVLKRLRTNPRQN